MIRKTLMVIFGAATLALITAGKHDGETILKASGSHISSTGAPGEQTCAQAGCHIDAVIQRDDNFAATNLILGNGEKTYTPATQYNLTLRAAKAGVGRFGFQIVALDSNNRSVGAFLKPMDNRVQLQSGFVNNSIRNYVTHTTAGNKPALNGETEWRFMWMSPLEYQGIITFYYCVNATNTDNTNAGDHLYLAAPTFSFQGTNGVENESVAPVFYIFPTIASDYLTIEQAAGFAADAEYAVVSAAGITLLQNYLENRSNVAVIPLALLPNGIYSLVLTEGSTRVAKRFVIMR